MERYDYMTDELKSILSKALKEIDENRNDELSLNADLVPILLNYHDVKFLYDLLCNRDRVYQICDDNKIVPDNIYYSYMEAFLGLGNLIEKGLVSRNAKIVMYNISDPSHSLWQEYKSEPTRDELQKEIDNLRKEVLEYRTRDLSNKDFGRG